MNDSEPCAKECQPGEDQEKIHYLTDYPDVGWKRVSFYMEPGTMHMIKCIASGIGKSEGAVVRKLIDKGMNDWHKVQNELGKESSDATKTTHTTNKN